MQWYYADKTRQVGPLSETQFQALVADGTVTPRTLVWNPNLTNWQEYGTLAGPGSEGGASLFKPSVCAECGRSFPQEEMIQYKTVWVCAACKPRFVQKLKEGVSIRGVMTYGGFWIRAVAKIIDGIILTVMYMVVYIPAAIFLKPPQDPASASIVSFVVMQLFVVLFQIGLSAAYTTWFLGKYGATPGKMACKLKVVSPEGDKISYLRAFGRHFAEMISMMIFYVGYIMAAFDREKRSLHDHICSTRVIRQ